MQTEYAEIGVAIKSLLGFKLEGKATTETRTSTVAEMPQADVIES